MEALSSCSRSRSLAASGKASVRGSAQPPARRKAAWKSREPGACQPWRVGSVAVLKKDSAITGSGIAEMAYRNKHSGAKTL